MKRLLIYLAVLWGVFSCPVYAQDLEYPQFLRTTIQTIEENSQNPWVDKLHAFTKFVIKNPYYPHYSREERALMFLEALLGDNHFTEDNYVVYMGTTPEEVLLILEVFYPDAQYVFGGYWTYEFVKIGEQDGQRYEKRFILLNEDDLKNAFLDSRKKLISRLKTAQNMIWYMGFKSAYLDFMTFRTKDLFIQPTSLELHNITFGESLQRIGEEAPAEQA